VLTVTVWAFPVHKAVAVLPSLVALWMVVASTIKVRRPRRLGDLLLDQCRRASEVEQPCATADHQRRNSLIPAGGSGSPGGLGVLGGTISARSPKHPRRLEPDFRWPFTASRGGMPTKFSRKIGA
jgi:hypothetical protein